MSAFQPYLCISASAGSGKTFQLSHRVLRLLAMRASPDEIGAYTFSRKAAGEIFDSIVAALRKAAETDSGAEKASALIHISHDREAFCDDLRRVFTHLHRLRIGTLDSRISQMLSAVSVEIGLPPEFSLMDTGSAEYQRLQNQVLNELFRSGTLKEEEADTFMQLFLEATHGKSEKRFMTLVQQFLSDHRSTFLVYPQMEAWKGPDLQNPPEILDDETRARLASECYLLLPESGFKEKDEGILKNLVDGCRHFSISSTRSDLPDNALAKRFLSGEGPEVKSGRSTLKLSDELWEKVEPLLMHVLAVSCQQVQSRTLALYGFLWVYQKAYTGTMLPGGQLSFEDACMLMADFDLMEPADMAFRLDGEVAHWLLDEFQDTNRLQWRVLEPFLSEILQDPGSDRSFFYVGDVKQAIYAWRGGDSELFGKVMQDWPAIQHESMAVSYRSAPPVLELVNQVFHDLPLIEDLPETAVKRWNAEFEKHEAAHSEMPGFAEVLQLKDKECDRTDVLLEMVRKLPPHSETAILVRTNDEGSEIADALRSAGLNVSQEGASELRNDTAVEAVLEALRQAAHPLDTYSRSFVKLVNFKIDPFQLLKETQQAGMTSAVRTLIENLPLQKDASFSKSRLKRLVDIALDFDRLGDPSIDRFLNLVEKTRIKENEARGVIRIMTIHQSKGLGFDSVIVPIKPSSTFSSIDHDQLATSTADAESPCVTLLPAKVVCQQIPEYQCLYERLEAEKTYETLCTLYVALTRAKQSLHILLPAPPKSRGSLGTVANWLRDRISSHETEQRSAGSDAETLATWGTSIGSDSALQEPKSFVEAPRPFTVQSGQKSIPRLEPSREASHLQHIDKEFIYFEKDGRELGSRVHALLEQVQWSDELTVDTFLSEQNEPLDSEAAMHVRNAFRMKEMSRPPGMVSLWREQRFESVLPEGWITGIFDRVVCFQNEAWIQDFKTNQEVKEETVDNYRPQMDLYRKVLADMLGFDSKAIRCQLLFTKTAQVFEI